MNQTSDSLFLSKDESRAAGKQAGGKEFPRAVLATGNRVLNHVRSTQRTSGHDGLGVLEVNQTLLTQKKEGRSL